VISTRWLDEREQRVWQACLQMQRQLFAQLNHHLQAESGLSLSDFEVLVQLTAAPDGRLRPFELQRNLRWEQSRLSHHLARMRRRGLVDRGECPSDSRGTVVTLTVEGRRAIETAAPGHVAAVRRLVFDHLTEPELVALEQIAGRVLDRLDADLS
jgi:DNA-binding MarR family transcriptional regulator